MYFQASADLASRHKDLLNEIKAIDSLIYEQGDNPIRIGIGADALDIELSQFARLLRLYQDARVLRTKSVYVCRSCDQIMEDEDGRVWCDECDVECTERTAELESVYLAVDPVLRLDDESFDAVATERVHVIQFISGDRGGATINQLQTPKEDKEILEAIERGRHRELYAMAHSIYGATIKDLTSAYKSDPCVLHFAGHGDDRSLSMIVDQELLAHEEPLTIDQIRRILTSFPSRVPLCVFNACATAAIARALADEGIVDAAIGWNDRVPDGVARSFGALFYEGLANGLFLHSAFTLAEQGCRAKSTDAVPVLCTAMHIDPRKWLPIHAG